MPALPASRVEFPHAPFMFGETLLDEVAQREALEKDARLRCREISSVVCPASASHSTYQPADRSAVIAGRIGAAQRAGDPPPRRLLPGHPVDEENDVPGFLAHQHVEDFEKRFRQESRPTSDLKNAEPKKRIEAFAVAEIGEGPPQIATRWFVERALFRGNAVAPDHLAQQLGVACLFEPLEGDRLAHQRVGDCSSIGVDNGTRSPLGVEDFLPKRDGAQPTERQIVEVGPSQCRGVEATVAGDEVSTEALLVLVRSDLQQATGTTLGRRMKRRTKRINRGTRLGRKRRES
jgi:hypothetical protein